MRSEPPTRSYEIGADVTTGEAQTAIAVETRTAHGGAVLVKRLQVFDLDQQHLTADRVVVAARPEAAESVARQLESAAQRSADHHVVGARGYTAGHHCNQSGIT